MTDEVIMAKVDSLFTDLQLEGVTEAVFACTNSDGMLGVKYIGEPKLLVYLTSLTELQILDNSMSLLSINTEEE
jgi:hypothetical protein